MWSTFNLKYLEALKQNWHMIIIPFVGKANGRQNNEGNVSIFTITIPASFSPPPFPTHEQRDQERKQSLSALMFKFVFFMYWTEILLVRFHFRYCVPLILEFQCLICLKYLSSWVTNKKNAKLDKQFSQNCRYCKQNVHTICSQGRYNVHTVGLLCLGGGADCALLHVRFLNSGGPVKLKTFL